MWVEPVRGGGLKLMSCGFDEEINWGGSALAEELDGIPGVYMTTWDDGSAAPKGCL